MKIASLDVISWEMCFNGEHFNGTVEYTDESDNRIQHKLTHPLTRNQAISLNKKEEVRGLTGWHKQGDMSDRYWTKESLEKDAIEYVKNIKYIGLLLGDGGNRGQPGEILYCTDSELEKKLEPLAKRADEMYQESCDPWLTFGEEADMLWDRWEELVSIAGLDD